MQLSRTWLRSKEMEVEKRFVVCVINSIFSIRKLMEKKARKVHDLMLLIIRNVKTQDVRKLSLFVLKMDILFSEYSQ